MRFLNVFLYEFYHFRKSSAKAITYFIFVFASIYAIYNGFDLQNTQQDTIANITQENKIKISKFSNWFEKVSVKPEALDVLGYIPSYAIKQPSPLLALGIGQAEQYGYYKTITNWSSTYDNDMVEEIANPERLVNGNIDFSFLIIFLLPVLLIILTYNIKGFEQDFNFDKLIRIQFGSIERWVFMRFVFYVLLLTFTVVFFILLVAIMNNVLLSYFFEISSLITLLIAYVFSFSAIFYFLVIRSSGSSEIAFKMIATWLLICVIIPGSVHQLASIKYPVSYMTEYLDSNRKETYEVFDLPIDSLHTHLVKIYPALYTSDSIEGYEINQKNKRNIISAIVSHMNKKAIDKIEKQNDAKNKFIRSTYWFNPVSFMQNKWNRYTETDYDSYKEYRMSVQKTIDKKIRLVIFEPWYDRKVTNSVYKGYLKDLTPLFN